MPAVNSSQSIPKLSCDKALVSRQSSIDGGHALLPPRAIPALGHWPASGQCHPTRQSKIDQSLATSGRAVRQALGEGSVRGFLPPFFWPSPRTSLQPNLWVALASRQCWASRGLRPIPARPRRLGGSAPAPAWG